MILGTYANLEAINQQQSVSDFQIERKPEIFKTLKNDAKPNRDPVVKSLVRSVELILPKTDESMKDNLPFKKMKPVKRGLVETRKEWKSNEESNVDENVVDGEKSPSNGEQNQSGEFIEEVIYTEY